MSLWEIYKAKRLGYADDLWTSLIGKKLGGYSWLSDYETTPYLYRAMPNLSHYYNREIMEEVVGGSVGWNQLCNGSSVTVQSGHKYFLKKGSAESVATSAGSAITGLTSGSDIVVDLTLALGSTIADYVYSLEQATAGSGVAWLKEHFPKMFGQYNPYDAGSIQSVSGLVSHDMVGFNQWDEEWEVGSYNELTGEPIDSSSLLRSKADKPIRVTPNTNYYMCAPVGSFMLFYDESDAFIKYTALSSNSLFITPANAVYARFRLSQTYGTTYNHDICINLSDASRNGEYEPYQKWSYPLDSTLTLRGIPKLDNGKLYYDGDEYGADGSVSRKYGIRPYQNGDESLADAVTDGTNTVYKLATPTTETAQPFTKTQLCDSGGTEEWTLVGKNLAYLEQGTLRFSTDGSEEPSASRVRTNFIPIETATRYMASSNGWVVKNGVGYDADKNYVGFGYYPIAESGEFRNVNEQVKYVRFIYGNSANTNCTPSDYWYQFEKGSAATPYEPYGFNIVSVGHKSKYAEK